MIALILAAGPVAHPFPGGRGCPKIEFRLRFLARNVAFEPLSFNGAKSQRNYLGCKAWRGEGSLQPGPALKRLCAIGELFGIRISTERRNGSSRNCESVFPRRSYNQKKRSMKTNTSGGSSKQANVAGFEAL